MRKIAITFIPLFLSLSLIAQSINTTFKFALVTDTHIGGSTGEEDLSRTVSDINKLEDIDFVIVSGDITEFGSYDELHTAKCLLDDLTVPYYAIPGNHDSNWSESGTNDFNRVFGSDFFGFDHKGFHFIGLASGPNMRMSPGQIPRENLTWFFNHLNGIGEDEPIIYINHYPMDNSLNNWFEVMDTLRHRNVQLMLCGHGHVNRKLNFEGIDAAMCRSNLRANDENGGYNIITITNDSIIFEERIVSTKTLEPWLAYSSSAIPQMKIDSPRPDFEMNIDNKYVSEIWSSRESSDMGGGMFLNDNILIYSNTAGEIKAIDTISGNVIWSYKTDGKIYSTPTVFEDIVWCGSSDSYLYGLNIRDGELIHKLKNDKPVVSSPVCTGGKVILAGSDGHCRAWNTTSGELVWDYDKVNNFVVTRPLIKDNTVYFGSWGNKFYALNVDTGNPIWVWDNGQANRMFSPAQAWPVSTHNKIYLASPDRYMTVLDSKTGNIVWRYNDLENRVRESIGVSEDGNVVYAKTMDGHIIAIDALHAERKVKWISSGEDMGYELAPTAIVEKDGIVYAPTDKGLIYAFNVQDGVFLWKYRVSFGLINMILPTNNRELYVSAMDGKLVKLKLQQ